PLPRGLVSDLPAPRAVRRSGRGEPGPGLPARPDHPTARAMDVRLAGLLPLDPRVAERAVLLGHARLLPRVLRDLVRVYARPVAQWPARRGAAHDLRRDGGVLR